MLGATVNQKIGAPERVREFWPKARKTTRQNASARAREWRQQRVLAGPQSAQVFAPARVETTNAERQYSRRHALTSGRRWFRAGGEKLPVSGALRTLRARNLEATSCDYMTYGQPCQTRWSPARRARYEPARGWLTAARVWGGMHPVFWYPASNVHRRLQFAHPSQLLGEPLSRPRRYPKLLGYRTIIRFAPDLKLLSYRTQVFDQQLCERIDAATIQSYRVGGYACGCHDNK